ncbi:hypothetical protein KSP39_PZI004713 [Platanthera zijinensis]|uniref:Uncharacterized protein n=1 Tax=Platanthera zijinensis TaxID=2320716 RepID=A0AAP0BX97_9ASPA
MAMRCLTTLLKSNLRKLRRSKTVSTDFSVIPLRRRRLHQPLKRARASAKFGHGAESFSPVYVDELFHRQPAAELNMKQQTEETPAVMKLQKPCSQSCGIGDSMLSNAGETATAIWDVDLRAEMFIRRFREEMKLQRQKSIGEYQEMLARGLS